MAELVDALVSKINELYARAGSIPAFGTKEQSVFKNFLRILVYIKPYYIHIFFGILIALLFATANVYFVPLFRDISREIEKTRVAGFNWQMVNLFVLWSIRIITQYGQKYYVEWVSFLIQIDIKQQIYERYQLLSQHFYSERRLGDLLTRLNDDSLKVQDAIVKIFSSLLPQGLTLLGVVTYLFYLNWVLTLFTLISVPFFVFVISYFTALIKRIAVKIQQKISNITHLSQESLMNIKVIQAYTLESFFIKRFRKVNLNNMSSSMTVLKFKYFKAMIEMFLQGLVVIVLLFIGGSLVSTGKITGPELISYFVGCALLIDPISAFSSCFTSISQSYISLDRIDEILLSSPKIKNVSDPITRQIKGDVVFENVSFKYLEKGENVLDSINLKARSGEMVAIVGLSGGGKSTLIDLIPRFYDPMSGDLLIDGINIKEYDLACLRSQMGMVLQDDILFSGTILENIKFGNLSVSEEQVIAACKMANAWDFISNFPQKLQTNVGDQGRRLSGGQKQRIAIARALLRDPRILILDEATSALDSESERVVQDALYKLMEGRTTFVVAHRLSTIKHANKIIVLDKGRLIEYGSHDELLSQKGKYFELYQVQFSS